MTDPDPGGPQTYRSYGSDSTTLFNLMNLRDAAKPPVLKFPLHSCANNARFLSCDRCDGDKRSFPWGICQVKI
jgi:hypothetical protein